MKKMMMIFTAIAGVLFFTAFIVKPVPVPNSGPAGKEIPADVLKIAQKSCTHCHTEPGNGMALMHLDLTNWAKYSPEKQAAKAADMCKMVTKDKMPPKSFRKDHPEGVPDANELKTICDWAASLQTEKKK